MKIIFIASDFSGLGKGTFSASLGRVLKSSGVNVRIMKCDLYFNYDAGTINPGEHGEVYVLADGTEVDQDFGIYERFLQTENNALDYLTSGRVFHKIYSKERAGAYLGQTVSVEHVIAEIKQQIVSFANQCELGIVELGATIGDIKGIYFLEAIRQLTAELGKGNTLFALLSHFPYLENVKELKTMGCQRSVNDLRSKGLKPDIIIARTIKHEEIPTYQLTKINTYCEVPAQAVFCIPNLNDQYNMPELIKSKLLHQYIATQLGLSITESTLERWYSLFDSRKPLNIALVGKYPHADAYVSIIHQLRFHGVVSIEHVSDPTRVNSFDGVILPGGWGARGVEDIIQAAQICREKNIPCLGICLGFQLMVVEYARNVLGFKNANSTEFNTDTHDPVIKLQENQTASFDFGGTSRLGNWTMELEPNSKLAKIYGKTMIVQRHRHRYEVSPNYNYKEFQIVGVAQTANLIEAMELKGHPFYIGVQSHPEFSAEKVPLFGAFVKAAVQKMIYK